MDDIPMDITPEDSPATTRGNQSVQPFDVDLGARIRAARRVAGMSQAALGEVVGVSFQQVQKYELGKDRISAATLFSFANALNVPVRSFFDGAPQHGPAKLVRSGTGDALSVKIALLFQQVDDPGIRKHLVALATALADGQPRGGSEFADGKER